MYLIKAFQLSVLFLATTKCQDRGDMLNEYMRFLKMINLTASENNTTDNYLFPPFLAPMMPDLNSGRQDYIPFMPMDNMGPMFNFPNDQNVPVGSSKTNFSDATNSSREQSPDSNAVFPLDNQDAASSSDTNKFFYPGPIGQSNRKKPTMDTDPMLLMKPLFPSGVDFTNGYYPHMHFHDDCDHGPEDDNGDKEMKGLYGNVWLTLFDFTRWLKEINDKHLAKRTSGSSGSEYQDDNTERKVYPSYDNMYPYKPAEYEVRRYPLFMPARPVEVPNMLQYPGLLHRRSPQYGPQAPSGYGPIVKPPYYKEMEYPVRVHDYFYKK